MADTTRTPESTPSNEPIAFDERTRRVMELRKQVQAGTYRPDAHEIAKAILEEWSVNGDALRPEPPAIPVETPSERQAAAARFVVEKTPDSQGRGNARTA